MLFSSYEAYHKFHVPVMGTGFTADSALRVSRFGIATVISIVDDRLLEAIGSQYAKNLGLDYPKANAQDPEARAERIRRYLDFVHDRVEEQVQTMRALPLEPGNDKDRYFRLLPESSPVRREYDRWKQLPEGEARTRLEHELTEAMRPGSIDVNIMVKLDREMRDRRGRPYGPQYTDAKAAVRGFALSKLPGNLVLSAGINAPLFTYMEEFDCFYRKESGTPEKGIIIKVSDFRSAMTQGKFLARKGLPVREFRVESGLNCGGHAFATDGLLMGPILEEFIHNRERWPVEYEPLIERYCRKAGKSYHEASVPIFVTAQGGIGHWGEAERLLNIYGLDGLGWGSPFLLVPEVVQLDEATRKKLMEAGEEDLYLSDSSPLGIPFNNLRGASSELWLKERIERGRPGSGCPKGHLALSPMEEGAAPICAASKEYQNKRLKEWSYEAAPGLDTPDSRVQAMYKKSCICDQLGNAALVSLGVRSENIPVAICPGPNLAYFHETYSLEEMVDHIYGRGRNLVPKDRPHMFVKELEQYVRYFEQRMGDDSPEGRSTFVRNLQEGIAYYRRMLQGPSFRDEDFEAFERMLKAWEKRLLSAAATSDEPEQETASVPADPDNPFQTGKVKPAPAAEIVRKS